jgi:hypothetical protein
VPLAPVSSVKKPLIYQTNNPSIDGRGKRFAGLRIYSRLLVNGDNTRHPKPSIERG